MNINNKSNNKHVDDNKNKTNKNENNRNENNTREDTFTCWTDTQHQSKAKKVVLCHKRKEGGAFSRKFVQVVVHFRSRITSASLVLSAAASGGGNPLYSSVLRD